MAHSLTDFKSRLIGGGARPNLFEVEITPGDLPSGIEALDGDTFKYLCKAANLPASNVASIDVPFRGRTFKVAGDRTFDTWTITVINDTDFKIRRTMEEWAQFVAQYQEASGATNPADYMASATVRHLGREFYHFFYVLNQFFLSLKPSTIYYNPSDNFIYQLISSFTSSLRIKDERIS